MALHVPKEQIDEMDTRIHQIVCRGCHALLFVEIGSYCDQLQRCTHCTIVLDNKVLMLRNS